MKLIRQLSEFPKSLRGCAVAIGNFDGVHRGHGVLIDQLKSFASELEGAAVVFTFDPHPVRILRPAETPPPLTWTNRKADLLAELGVDAVVAYPTNKELLALSYQDFYQQIVIEALGAKAMVEGPNFFFGRGREGNTDRLKELCSAADVRLKIVVPREDDGELISSSRIRRLIQTGDVDAAVAMLTQDAIDTLIPAMGVYAGRTYVDGRSHWSAIHIGPNPTFGESHRKVESHLLNFEGSIYGKSIEVDFVSRLRDIRQFESAELLVQQLKSDVDSTREIARSFTG